MDKYRFLPTYWKQREFWKVSKIELREAVGIGKRALGFQVQDRGIGKGVDLVDFDDVFFDGADFASAQGNQVGADGCSGGEYPSHRVIWIDLWGYLKNRSLLGSVIPIKPIQHPDFRKLFHSQKPRLVFFVDLQVGLVGGFRTQPIGQTV